MDYVSNTIILAERSRSKYLYTLTAWLTSPEFLDGLDKKKELSQAIRLIDLLAEFGPQLPRPHASFLEKGIYELRIRVRRMQYRILYFYFYQDKIILSHGLRKEKKVPTAEIKKAQEHKLDYFSKHERIK